MNISYNSITFNSIGLENPYLLLDENMVYVNKKWINQRNINLQGMMTGDFNQITTKQTALVNMFSTDFKTLQVDSIPSFTYCKVNNINFPESNYQNILNYSVSLLSYGDNFNSVNSGILDPVNEISINENNDGTFIVTHNISARGINKSSSALNAAKTFVDSLKGISQYNIGSLQQFNTNLNDSSFVLKNFSQGTDRINGSCSIKEDYIFNSSLNDINPADGVLKYSVEYRSGLRDDFATADVRGTIEYDKDVQPDASQISALASAGTLKSKAEAVLGGSVNAIPESFNINVEKGKLDFNFTYINNVITQPYFDYKLSFRYDKIYSKTVIEISGPVIVKGNLKQRNTQLDTFLAAIPNMETYLYNIVNSSYSTWCSAVGSNVYILRPKANNLSVRRSLPKGTLEISANFDDGITAWPGFISNSFSINYNPTLELIYPKPNCLQNGYYILLQPDIWTLPNLSIRANGLVELGQENNAETNTKSFEQAIKSACTNALAITEIAKNETINFSNPASLLESSINTAYTSKTKNQKHSQVVRSII
jgi:hypothetical protein